MIMAMEGVGEETDTDESMTRLPSFCHLSSGGGEDWAMHDCWKLSPSKTSRVSMSGIIRGRSASVDIFTFPHFLSKDKPSYHLTFNIETVNKRCHHHVVSKPHRSTAITLFTLAFGEIRDTTRQRSAKDRISIEENVVCLAKKLRSLQTMTKCSVWWKSIHNKSIIICT